jgi:acyl-CoA synthetase (AMP-forming)/AMP-acid ligase II
MLQTCSAGGDRVLLLYPTGLEFIAAYFGCLYAGVIAVPVPPPNPAQPQRTLPRVQAITNDARPSVAFTTSSLLSQIEGLFTQAPDLRTMRWLASDTVAGTLAEGWEEPAVTSTTRALLQYPSGSTTAPRGVMVSHGNLLHNSANISQAFEITADTVSVTWLPVFHDMG